ncbi:PucR family transcriptional regulator [Lentzea sp. NPDC004789]
MGTDGAADVHFEVDHRADVLGDGVQFVAEVTAAVLSSMPMQRTLGDDAEKMRKLVQRAVDKAVTAFATEHDNEGEPRLAIAQALLSGQPVDDLAAATRTQLADAHVVLMVDGGVGGSDVVHTLLPSQANRRTALVAPSGRHLFVLVPVPRPANAEAVITTMRERNAGLMVAVSVASTRDSVPRAANEVRMVMRVVHALNRDPAVYQLEDVPIEAALIRSPDSAKLLAARLAALPSSGAPLLETLFSYLDHGEDRTHAARELHVHPNTLDYRLRRIRELTGLSPWRPRDLQTLGVAAIALRLTEGADLSAAS